MKKQKRGRTGRSPLSLLILRLCHLVEDNEAQMVTIPSMPGPLQTVQSEISSAAQISDGWAELGESQTNRRTLLGEVKGTRYEAVRQAPPSLAR